MPSDLVIEVCRVEKVEPHTNADRLHVCQVKGWQVVTGKDDYKEGDLVVYFPPDTLLSEKWTDEFNVTQYCHVKNNMRRIHRVKLRGEPSFGLIVPVPYDYWQEGREVSGFYEAKKYEPPMLCKHANAAPEDPTVPVYSKIQNMRNYPRVFETGEEVIVTEKIHGTNVRLGITEGVHKAGSHKHMRKQMTPDEMAVNWYWYPWTVPAIAEMMEDLGNDYKQVSVYGETFGSVQFLRYNAEGKLDFRVFDIMLDFNWLSYDEMLTICGKHKVQTVPLIARIPFDMEAVKDLSEGMTTVNGATHMREGVVVRPVIERKHPKIGRVILKFVSDTYLFNKKATASDNTDG